jgi:hypothetical protein
LLCCRLSAILSMDLLLQGSSEPIAVAASENDSHHLSRTCGTAELTPATRHAVGIEKRTNVHEKYDHPVSDDIPSAREKTRSGKYYADRQLVHRLCPAHAGRRAPSAEVSAVRAHTVHPQVRG